MATQKNIVEEVFPETLISPILYLSTLFCEYVGLENNKMYKSSNTLGIIVSSFVRF